MTAVNMFSVWGLIPCPDFLREMHKVPIPPEMCDGNVLRLVDLYLLQRARILTGPLLRRGAAYPRRLLAEPSLKTTFGQKV